MSPPNQASFADRLLIVALVMMGLGVPMLALGRIPLFVALGGGIVLATAALLIRNPGGFLAAMRRDLLIPGLGACCLVVLAVSAALSHRPEATLLKVADLGVLFLLLWLGVTVAGLCSPRQLRWLVYGFAAGLFAALFYNLGDAANCTYNQSIDELYRWCVKRGRHRGTAFAVLCPVAIGMIFHLRDRQGMTALAPVGFLLILAMTLAVFLSNGRTAWGAMMAGLVFLTILGIRHGNLRGIWQGWAALIAAGGIWYWLTITYQARVLVSRGQVTSGDYGAFNGRETSWLEALRLWQENPVLGVGVWNYRDLVDHFNHPHGFLPELLSDTGTLGTVLVLAMVLIMVVRLFRRAGAGPLTAGCAAGFGTYFVAASAATSIFYGWWLFVLFGVIILGTAARRLETGAEADDKALA